ncbi:MAG: hypothetical protein AMXMBFR53_39630 [Gemmatimonadota bacterium]
MPVYTRLNGEALVVTVDGDYTPGELRRVAERGLQAPDTPRPARVLLDMSGAAASPERAAADVAEAVAFLASLAPEVERVAVQTHPVRELPGSARVFQTRAEALAWLNEEGR